MDTSLSTRIEKLESEIRRWKLLVLVILIGAAAMLITAPAPAQRDDTKHSAKLEAHDFTLLGPDDKPYGRLYIKDNQPVLELYDHKGKVIWSAPPHGGFTPVDSR